MKSDVPKCLLWMRFASVIYFPPGTVEDFQNHEVAFWDRYAADRNRIVYLYFIMKDFKRAKAPRVLSGLRFFFFFEI